MLMCAGILVMMCGMILSPSAIADNGNIATLRETSRAFTTVANGAIPAVVAINVKKVVTRSGSGEFYEDFFERFFGRPAPRQESPKQREYEQQGIGSGFLISEDGYILTNNHVVQGASEVSVTFNDGTEKNAEIVGTDPRTDVAVIKIEGDGYPYIELGDSDALEIGEWVIAVGNPFGLEATVTVGVVSAKGRGANITEYDDFIQTDAAINPGNSGGPLLNIEGKAVGINTAIVSRSGGYMGIGFAIPMALARDIKEQLVETGKVTRGYVGIYMRQVDPEVAEYLGLSRNMGVEVSDVVEGSPADEAGLRAGDILLEMNGEPIRDMRSFKREIARQRPGSRVRLEIFRDEKRRDVTVKLGSLEESEFAIETEVDQLGERFGLTVRNLTDELAEQFGFEKGDGVLISEVESGSSAADQGLAPGMLIMKVNNRDVSNVDEFNEAISAVKSDKVLVLINDGRASRLVVLKAAEDEEE